MSRPETPHQELEEAWNDWATHIHPTAPQVAKRIPVWSSAADSRWTEPVRQTCGTRSHLLFDGMKLFATETKICIIDRGTLTAPCSNDKCHQQANMEPMPKKWVCSDKLAYIIRSHYVPTRITKAKWWWYLQISRRRWNSLNFILASWSWYRYPSIPFF